MKKVYDKDVFDFTPPWWLRNRHLQSCFSTIFPKQAKAKLVWEELDLPDGDFIDLCWTGPEYAPIVILLHGLEGSVNSHYIQLMLDILTQAGWRVVVMHFRTCSGRLNRLSRSYHAGETEDLHYLVKVLSMRYPYRPLLAVGFSLGGNVLLHYLKEYPQSPISRAAAISVPFELSKCVDYAPNFYQWKLLHTLKQKTIKKIKQGLTMPVTLSEIEKIKDFRCFDDIVTAPLHGFCGAKDYYEQMSIRPFLKDIMHPTLIVHSEDDPLVPANAIPKRPELSRDIQFELHHKGGHVGFIQGNYPWRLRYWLTDRILSWLLFR